MSSSIGGGGGSPGFIKGMAYILTGKPIDGSKAPTPFNIDPKGKSHAEQKMDNMNPQQSVINNGRDNFGMERVQNALSKHKAKQEKSEPNKSFLNGVIHDVGTLVSGKKDKAPEGRATQLLSLEDHHTEKFNIGNNEKIKPFNAKSAIQENVVLRPAAKNKERASAMSSEFVDKMIKGDKDAIRNFLHADPSTAGTRDTFRMLNGKMHGILQSDLPTDQKSALIGNILNITKEYYAINAGSIRGGSDTSDTLVEIHAIANLAIRTNDGKLDEALSNLRVALRPQPRASSPIMQEKTARSSGQKSVKLEVLSESPRGVPQNPANRLRHFARELNPKSSKDDTNTAWNLYKETITNRDPSVQAARTELLQKLKELKQPKVQTNPKGIAGAENEIGTYAYTKDKKPKEIQRDFAAILDHAVLNISHAEIDAVGIKENEIDMEGGFGYKMLNPQVAPNIGNLKLQGQRMNALISEEILLSGNSKDRREIITKYLDAANLAYQKGNFNTVFVIMQALESRNIRRLPEYKNLDSPIKDKLAPLIDPHSQFGNYKNEVNKRMQNGQPFVPYWGVISGQLGLASNAEVRGKVKTALDENRQNFIANGGHRDELQQGSPTLEIFLEKMVMKTDDDLTRLSEQIIPVKT